MRKINCYGETTEAERFDFRKIQQPDDTKFVDGSTFNRFGTADPCAIHRLRLGEGGIVEELWAYGKWNEAERLTYERTIDETMEVEV